MLSEGRGLLTSAGDVVRCWTRWCVSTTGQSNSSASLLRSVLGAGEKSPVDAQISSKEDAFVEYSQHGLIYFRCVMVIMLASQKLMNLSNYYRKNTYSALMTPLP